MCVSVCVCVCVCAVICLFTELKEYIHYLSVVTNLVALYHKLRNTYSHHSTVPYRYSYYTVYMSSS